MVGKTKISAGGLVIHERLDAAFPDKWLMKTARETGLVKRMRSFSPVLLFWVMTLQVGVQLRVSFEAMRRRYNESAEDALAHASFLERFTPELVDFLHECVLRGIEQLGALHGRELSPRLKRFKDILIQDSTIIRLHEALVKKWPATLSRRRNAAGVKLSCVLSVVSDGPKHVKLVGERTSEIKTLHVGKWVKDCLLLIDLGFFKYGVFDRIDKNGGFFVSRLKDNADPTITTLLRVVRGNSVLVEGGKLRSVLPKLKREVLDAEVVVNFSHRAYAGKKTGVSRKLRVVCIKDDETNDYHAYITNLSPGEFSAEDVASLYRARWEVELVFRELKNEYSIDMIPTKNPEAVKALVWTGILTLIIQRIRFVTMLELYPERAHEMSHERSAKLFREKTAGMTFNEILERRDLRYDAMDAQLIELCGAFDPHRENSVHIKEWRA